VIVPESERNSAAVKSMDMGEGMTMRRSWNGAYRRVKVGLVLIAILAALAAAAGSASAADPFEISRFEAGALQEDLSSSVGAGERPQSIINNFSLSLTPGVAPNEPFPAGNVKEVISELPPGIVGNAASFPRCEQEAEDAVSPRCPTATQVGWAKVQIRWPAFAYPGGYEYFTVPVFNMEPPPGSAAQFAFRTTAAITHVDFHVRSGSDYGVTAIVRNINETAPVMATNLTIWGVPGDPSNDARRVPTGGGIPGETVTPYPEPGPYKPLLSNPTSCGRPQVFQMAATTWQNPGLAVSATPSTAPAMQGCGELAFDPAVAATPTTDQADSPSGLGFHLHIPQNQDAEGKAVAQLRDSTVKLPPSLTVNPSSANGLGACSIQQIGYLGQGAEKQLIQYDPQAVGSYQVSFKGQTTAPIPGAAGRATVAAALEGLPGLAGNISVSGAAGAWIVSFGGTLAGADVPTLTGTVDENPSQTVDVTGTGGFNLQYEGAGTGATYEGNFEAGAAFVVFGSPSAPLSAGEWLEGPGLAPATKAITAANTTGAAIAILNNPTVSAQTGAVIRSAIDSQAPAATVAAALEAVPALKGKVGVALVGSSGETRTYKVFFGGDLARGEPALLTATNSLEGPGAGVTVARAPHGTPALEVTTIEDAGAPQFTAAAADCPNESKIGTVTISSPAVLDHALEGSVYLATPHENPFDSLLAMYITADDPKSGVVVKLPGLIEADPQSGQLTATVSDAPQLPFEDLDLEFFSGDAAPLKTGIVCGTYETTTAMVPWTAPEGATKHPSSSFAISQGCAAGEGQAPKSTSFEAGTVSPSAGAYSPFVLKLSRPDGSQQLTGIDATLPKGLLAKLAGVPYCSDQALATAAGKSGKEERANPSCPAASQVGTVTVAAGAGGKPFYAPGKAYLAGPYKGAPLSLAVVTPAVAGPFDLGTVVVRNALNVDPTTAQVHAVSDPFPHILQGIPLDIRSIALTLDRSEFTRNPTSCNPFAIEGSAALLSGQTTPLSQLFQAAGCSKLGFSPKLSLTLKGQVKRTGHPAIEAVLNAPAGQANIANATVILPKSEFIDQAHVNGPCTRVQFNAEACPPESVLGTAVAYTPLLEKPLEGPVYFRSNGGERQLPDIVADLNGQIHVVLVGFIDSVKVDKETTRVRTRFATVPDAPVSKFVLKLKGGKRGLLQNSKNLCQVKPVANVQMTGQNGKTHDFEQKIGTSCGSGKKKSKGKNKKN
jgi:hypothetical protein